MIYVLVNIQGGSLINIEVIMDRTDTFYLYRK
ncbi:hypothetical protein SAMN06265364_11747 [Prevotella jejuni]|uniref:Uncharacterized protein n=1 Tax=Prevotella jejuni TaxID=1177574 RepID=A0AA94IUH0_9BACT|nr:hypothetical protein SAMN06265364_11747 [Prevotella jejuni]